MPASPPLSRRRIIAGAIAFPALSLIRTSPTLAATPACGGTTAAQTEGPYFKPQSPLRASLIEPGMGGERLQLSGQVLTRSCRPVAGAVLEFWQSDDRGRYDNAGFRFRGHQVADAEGRFDLITITPGAYPGRTRHIHVKVAAPGRPALTTQLYFPGDPGNARDGIYRKSLEMTRAGDNGRFDFVLDLA